MSTIKKLVKYPSEMGDKLSMVVHSHLSDVLMELDKPNMVKVRVNFIKHLINLYGGDLTIRVDIDKHFTQYLEYYGIEL